MMKMEIVNTKWIATVASIWIQSSVGASYTFGIYSSILKSSQGYDQSTLDTVSVFKDIGANAGILSGLLYSAFTLQNNRRRLVVFAGPCVVLLAGAIQSFLGYFVMWASVVGLIRRLPVAVMCFFTWMAAHAQTFSNTTNVVSGVHNFGDYGGTIVGIMKVCLLLPFFCFFSCLFVLTTFWVLFFIFLFASGYHNSINNTRLMFLFLVS
jgi:hypothetical protein